MNPSIYEGRATRNKERGSARFLIILVIALALAAAGIWMASRKSGSPQSAVSSEPSNAAASDKAAQPLGEARPPRPDAAPTSMPEPSQSPIPSPSPTARPGGTAPTSSAVVGDARASTPAAPALTDAYKAESNAARRVTISGTVTETHQYCGGANPSEEILEAVRRPRPVANYELYVRAGSANALANPVLLKFSTDASGNFQIALPEGDYCIIEAGKKDALKVPDFTEENRKLAKTDPTAIPYSLTGPKCLTEWWQTCDKALRVGKENQTGVRIEFQRGCRPPCVQGGPDAR